jgi:hypothetical protein
MISTIQVLVLLLAVVAAVAVIGTRLGLPDPILLVLTGVGLALVAGLPPVELAPELVLLLALPPVIYMSAVTMSWREVRLNLGPISLLCGRLRRVHNGNDRRCSPLAIGPPLAGWLCLGGNRLAAGYNGAIVDRPTNGDPPAHSDHPRGRRAGKRCHCPHSLPVRSRKLGCVLRRPSGRNVRHHRMKTARTPYCLAFCWERSSLMHGGRARSSIAKPSSGLARRRRSTRWRSPALVARGRSGTCELKIDQSHDHTRAEYNGL